MHFLVWVGGEGEGINGALYGVYDVLLLLFSPSFFLFVVLND